MKKITIILALFLTLVSKADTWTELSLAEAKVLKTYLTKNPYILDYCDCCDIEGEYASKTYLYKITSMEIIESEWGDGNYNLKASVEEIVEIQRIDKGLQMNSLTCGYNYASELTLSMNYTWGFNQVNRKVTPLYSIVPHNYDYYNASSGYCNDFTDLPNPNSNTEIKDQDYINWYESTFNK